MSPMRPAAAAALAAGVLSLVVPTAALAETTEYQVTFQSTWSQVTHPIDFPSFPHFSGLIGGTHNGLVSFWDLGALASPGIQNMAELGSKAALTAEVNAAIGAGTADAVLSGGGITVSPGSVSLTFNVDDAFPLVTLVSMLAPSPDWFVGVSGLSLRENGAWVPQIVVDLHVYDAGTDSGPTYTSPNQPTVPPDPISALTTGPFATSNLVGTFTFTHTGAVGVREALARDREPLVLMGPNPLREGTRFQIRVPGGSSGELAVYGIRGQRLRSLFRGETAGETRVIAWNGRDDRGVSVPSGVYYVTLRVGGREPQTERVVVAR